EHCLKHPPIGLGVEVLRLEDLLDLIEGLRRKEHRAQDSRFSVEVRRRNSTASSFQLGGRIDGGSSSGSLSSSETLHVQSLTRCAAKWLPKCESALLASERGRFAFY